MGGHLDRRGHMHGAPPLQMTSRDGLSLVSRHPLVNNPFYMARLGSVHHFYRGSAWRFGVVLVVRGHIVSHQKSVAANNTILLSTDYLKLFHQQEKNLPLLLLSGATWSRRSCRNGPLVGGAGPTMSILLAYYLYFSSRTEVSDTATLLAWLGSSCSSSIACLGSPKIL